MGNVEIPNWLKGLPLAPVFRPTDTEFADPIAYISKIEKEASAFGICKIIPPLPKPSKKYVFSNLNKSLSKCPDVGPDVSLPSLGSSSKIGRGNCSKEGELRAVFTTRQQELGQSTKRAKGVGNNPQLPIGHRQVWQSGEVYTLEQFEAKSKAFSRSTLGMVKEASPLAVESLFWKAVTEKPIYVDYANDVPGSAFGEPEGQSRYLRRRRKMRTRSSYQRQCEEGEAGDVKNPCAADSCENRDTSARINISVSTCSGSSTPLCSMSCDNRSTVSMKNSSNNDSSNEMEGSAGWKLSNSQWNLQVIARSAGSLTRFMPDDIPGVTSPMIYIGMLFSWFAWHVEDHELHSLNYLHMGSPKTWYSVPGDYALDFEEVIRMDAYGGNIDQLAALSRLGEKTTLVSPELIVASGVPCYRLIQNPGEFVVTFPRAYHIGFSHGFNCGEAANFATPQWLRFAREAAVRRAAMNYLPMLSHQQLLYLLTMSFVSRVPRSLLPGARSSRLRDRQREEREILVKRAFVEDMQNENHLLSSLLEKDSTYHAVVWNPNVLPSLSKPTGLPDATTSALTPPTENIACDSSEHNSLLEELSFFAEQNEVDMENQEFFFDFQVDAGTLACVACGILGFPFMCVIQPSETATQERLSTEDVPDARCFDTSHGDQAITSGTTIREGWCASDKLRRPRIFCLEHAIQVRELVQSKGGVNLLVICHSDYQKMKAYAAVLAEETNMHFDCREIPLDVASQEDLHLIELAIVDDEKDRYGKDWTSYLGINLRHCVRVRKNNPSKRVQHALSLGRLFSTEKSSPTSNAIRVKWKSRKSRSKPRADYPQNSESCKSLPRSEAILQKNSDSDVASKAKDIIQYTRRTSKSSYRNSKKLSASQAVSADVEHEVRVLEAPGDIDSEFLPAQVADSPASTSQYAGTVEVQVISQISDVMDVEEERCDTEGQDEEEEIETSRETSCCSPIEATLGDNAEIRRDKLGTLADLAEQTIYTASQSADDTRANKMMEIMPSQADNDSSEMPCSLLKCKSANNHVGSGEECPDAAVDASGGNKVSDCSPSLSGSTLQPHMEENSGNAIADKECNEASEEVQDRYSSDSAGSDHEARGEACTTSGVSDKKLESECRSSHDLNGNEGEVSSSEDQTEQRTMVPQVSDTGRKRKRKSEVEMIADNEFIAMGFVKSPCESLRPRSRIRSNIIDSEGDEEPKKKVRQQPPEKAIRRNKKETTSTSRDHRCNLDGCQMSFKTREELSLHKRNQCPHEGCGKKFSSHKYAVLHQRVHEDDRPLKCPWEGCRMSFKWAWARTEHIRVHTGERPYKCQVDGCGLSFRFISDYNRHRRKTGHYVS